MTWLRRDELPLHDGTDIRAYVRCELARAKGRGSGRRARLYDAADVQRVIDFARESGLTHSAAARVLLAIREGRI